MKAELVVTYLNSNKEQCLFVNTKEKYETDVRTGELVNIVHHGMIERMMSNEENDRILSFEPVVGITIDITVLVRGDIVKLFDWSWLENEFGNHVVNYEKREREDRIFEVVEVGLFPTLYKPSSTSMANIQPKFNTLKIKDMKTGMTLFSRASFTTLYLPAKKTKEWQW